MTSLPTREQHGPNTGPAPGPFPPARPTSFAWPSPAPGMVPYPLLPSPTPTSAPVLPSLRSTLRALAHTEFTPHPFLRYPALHVGFPATMDIPAPPLTFGTALHPIPTLQPTTSPPLRSIEVKPERKNTNTDEWVLDVLAEMSSASNPDVDSSPLPALTNMPSTPPETSPPENTSATDSEPLTKTPKKGKGKKESIGSSTELVFVSADDKDKLLSRRRRPLVVSEQREKEMMAELTVEKLLATHKRTDQGYQCDRCVYSTPQIGNLQQHLYSHEGIRPFKCSECDYASSFSSAIVRHRQVHEQGKRFQCPSCDYCVKQNYNLRRHLARSHHMSTKEAMETVRAISLAMADQQGASPSSSHSSDE